MPEFLKKFKPFNLIGEYQDKHYDAEWREQIGIKGESLAQLQEGLQRELIELHDSIKKGNNVDIANEIADVIMFSLTALKTLDRPFQEIPVNDGESLKSFEDLQRYAKKLAKTNGYRIPRHNLDHVLDNIQKLTSNGELNSQEIIELSANNIVLSSMIISQLNIPLGDVMRAKHSRNLDKYSPTQINLIKELNQQDNRSAMQLVRSEWNPKLDRKYLQRQLGLLGYGLLYLSTPITKIKGNLPSFNRAQPVANK